MLGFIRTNAIRFINKIKLSCLTSVENLRTKKLITKLQAPINAIESFLVSFLNKKKITSESTKANKVTGSRAAKVVNPKILKDKAKIQKKTWRFIEIITVG